MNEKPDAVFERLLNENADVVTFSCYIWNIKAILELCRRLKNDRPDTVIILGGPEVAYRQKDILEKYGFVDFVLSGEGELVLPKLLNCLERKDNPEKIEGVSFISSSRFVIKNEAIGEFFDYPSPYCDEYFKSLNGRIAYIESSRGCPFSCAYCLSGRCGKVRNKDIEKTEAEILLLASSGTKTVKFVDRTFNCDNDRAVEIMRFIRENRGKAIPDDVCFHFEISADILRQSFIDEVALSKKGELQFEIGIQSLNEKTLSAIGRKSDRSKLFSSIKKLTALKNCHIHTDLIAGLTHETYESFKEGFNECYFLGANMLQVGFLKLLYGSEMRFEKDKHPCEFSSEPPYEVIATATMSKNELKLIHTMENQLDRLHNSGRFRRTLSYLLTVTKTEPFDLFLSVGEKMPKSCVHLDEYTDRLFEIFLHFDNVEPDILRDAMLYDRLASNNSGVIPKSLYHYDERLKKVKNILSESFRQAKGTNRCVAILYSQRSVIFSDYLKKDAVSGEYEVTKLPFEFFGETFFDFDIDKSEKIRYNH